MRIAPLSGDDVGALQELIESQADYTERITGYPPGPSDALSTLLMRPEGMAENAKCVYGAWEEGRLVGAVDVIVGYPRADVAFIGLLLVHGTVAGRGYGRRTHDLVVGAIREEAPHVQTLRLAIVDTNAEQAEPFWKALGYQPTGEAKPYRYDQLTSTSRLWERSMSVR